MTFVKRQNYQHIGAAGAAKVQDGVVVITGGSATAVTLSAPGYSDNGMRIRFVAGSAHAHTVTYATGFNAGGASLDVATFGGAIGDGFEVVAHNGTWLTTNLTNVTLG